MKPKSISGVVFFVDDIEKSAKFYELLGFRAGKKSDGYMTLYVNWFWIDFVERKLIPKDSQYETELNNNAKGVGTFLNISVEDVDDFYNKVKQAGIEPKSEPADYPWGRREFVLHDPDDYKLVIFSKK